MLISRTTTEFQPSTGILKAMTWVRRSPIGYPVAQRGLFGEHETGRDYALFALAILGEVIGIMMIARYMPMRLALGLMLAAVIIDIALALWHHRCSCPRILNVKQYLSDIESVDDPKLDAKRTAESYALRISRRRASALLPATLLIAVTAVKVFFFYVANGRRVDTALFGMCAVYIAICLIHLYVTGYALSHIRASGWFGLWGFSKELNDFNSDPKSDTYKAKQTSQKVFGGVALQEFKTNFLGGKSATIEPTKQVSFKVRDHELSLSPDEGWLMLNSKGVLYDEDIKDFMNFFKTSHPAQIEVAKACLFIQSHKLVTEE